MENKVWKRDGRTAAGPAGRAESLVCQVEEVGGGPQTLELRQPPILISLRPIFYMSSGLPRSQVHPHLAKVSEGRMDVDTSSKPPLQGKDNSLKENGIVVT